MAFTQQVLPQKQWVSYRVLTAIVLVTLLVAFLVFSNLGRLWNFMTGQTQTGETLRIGQSISLTGTIVQNGDYVTHTHTMSVPVYGIVGIKSKTIDLNQYTGVVQINGVVEKKVQDMLFVVEVTSVSGGQSIVLDPILTGWSQGQYSMAWWVYFPENFSQKFTLQWPNGGDFSFTHLASQQKFTLHAFACSSKDPNADCLQLVKNISPTADKKFTDSYGNAYYKLEGVRSWLVVNGFYYGYFVQDADEQVVRDFAAEIVLLTSSYVKDHLVSKIVSLCSDGSTSMQQVAKQTVTKELNGLTLLLEWTTASGTATCKIVLDPSLAQGGQKLSFTPSMTASSVQTPPSSSSTPTTPSALDFSVKQFPTSTTKTMTYTSSRGHTIVFPSSNLSYGSFPLNEDLSSMWARCSSQFNVIAFVNKPNLATTPTIKIFECTAKKSVTLPSNAYRQISLADGRIFIIEIMDGAWKTFADMITIQ